jgi:hypothetical protein
MLFCLGFLTWFFSWFTDDYFRYNTVQLFMSLYSSIVHLNDVSWVCFEVPKEDSQEEIQQNDRSDNDKRDKVEVRAPSLASQDSIKHYLPVITNQNDKDSNKGMEKVVKILSWGNALIQIHLLDAIELYVIGIQLHSEKSVDKHEQKKQN